MSDPFIHLRSHSAYSLLEGAMHIDQLINLAIHDAQPALALTDRNNLFGALEFSKKASEKGLQAIIGATLHVDFQDHEADASNLSNKAGLISQAELVFIAGNETGYLNLMALVSKIYLAAHERSGLYLLLSDIEGRTEGLHCLAGGADGAFAKPFLDNNAPKAESRLSLLRQNFSDRLYLDVQRHNLSEEKSTEPFLINFAYDHSLPLLATNKNLFAKSEDFEAHDVLTAIAQGTVINDVTRKRLTDKFAFQSQRRMKARFKDLPEAISFSSEIAQRLSFAPQSRRPLLPKFTQSTSTTQRPTQQSTQLYSREDEPDEAKLLKEKAYQGLKERLKIHGCADDLKEDDYFKRLDYELDVIQSMDFPGYFLIVADFIQWAKLQSIPVGPGRGSGAGSVVAWALTITDLDPLQFSLLFERFLNPDRISMPDFDIDFCQDRRDEVIAYVQNRYGHDKVAQIITFGSLQARAVLRDVGRVLQMPYGQVDRLCKLIPSNPANPLTLIEAIEQEPRLRQAAKEEAIVDKLLKIGKKLEGLYRHASTHAAGVVIGDRPLQQLVPLFQDSRSTMPATQFNMKWVEEAGLVKFDFLGLKTLSVIQATIDLLQYRDITIDCNKIDIKDDKTFALYGSGETVGVFQVESAGMRRALTDMKPDRFEDIIALVALYRPGPMDNIPLFNARKHGLEKVDYLHPLLEPILQETFGIIVYQEQVMEIAQKLSGYSLGEADILRRAMGKKIRSEMDKQKERFINGAKERGISANQSDRIFDSVAKFANYGFNKSHAAAYALVSYQTAYLKAHYPVEFLAASMTYDLHNTDKLSEFHREALRLDIDILTPCVNRSHIHFHVDEGAILYALSALKGVGTQAAEHLFTLRNEGGIFQNLDDFANRIDPRIINKRCLESLILSGALDCFAVHRAKLIANCENILAHAQRCRYEAQSGQSGLFASEGNFDQLHIVACDDVWPSSILLQKEMEAIGFYISAHPLDEYRERCEGLKISTYQDFTEKIRSGDTGGRVAAVILNVIEKKTKKGNRIGILNGSDSSGHFEAILFSDLIDECSDLLEPGKLVLLDMAASYQDEEIRLRIQNIHSLEEKTKQDIHQMRIFLSKDVSIQSLSSSLKEGDGGQVIINMADHETQKEIEVSLGNDFCLSNDIASALRSLPGVLDVTLNS